MAIRNFIKNGSYARIERVDFVRSASFCQVMLAVYEDASCAKLLVPEIPFVLSGNSDALKIDRVISEEDDYLRQAPDFSNVNAGEVVLVNLHKPKDAGAVQFNHNAITRTPEGFLSFGVYPLVEVDGKTFKHVAGEGYTGTVAGDPLTKQQFRKLFDGVTKEKVMYEYIMGMAAFAESISDE